MKLCMGCMEQIDDKQSICPYCGFNEKNNSQESYCLTPGSIISGKYIVGRSIGYSGQIISYIGMDAETNKKIVIKEYLPGDFATRSEGETDITIYSGDAKEQFDNGLSRFLNEASGVQSLGSVDGIVRVADCVIENDTGYVITDYIKGNTLKTILDSGKKYSLSEAVPIVACLLSGLSRVHQMNIIHCDIAPENIIIDERGGVSLDNFGAARYVTSSNSKSLAILLKQGYAAEEQYRASGKRGPWTDVYGIAAVLYRMITGVVPQESVERTLNDELKAPSKLGVSIPDNIENALMNALNIYQEERTQTTGDFLKELSSSNVKRRVTEKSKKKSLIPMWGKVAIVAGFSALVIGGIVVGINLAGSDDHSASSNKEVVGDERGENIKDISYSDYSTEYVYTSDPSNDNIIKRQSIIGTLEKDSELIFYIYSSDRVGYSDIREGWSMNALSMQAGVKGISEDKYQGDEDADSYDYGKIISIETKDGEEISEEDIEKKDSSIIIDNITKIRYQAKNYFFWDSFPDFQKLRITDIKPQQLYKKKADGSAEPDPGKTGTIADSNALVDNSWYSFEHDEGYIFYQERIGEKVDMSVPQDHPPIYVIGTRLSAEGKAGVLLTELQKKLQCQVVIDKDGKETDNVKGVEVSYAGQDKEADVVSEDKTAFKSSNDVKLIIKVEKQVPTSETKKSTDSKKTTESQKAKDSKKPAEQKKTTETKKTTESKDPDLEFDKN